MAFSGALNIEAGSGNCTFLSDSIPNHDFNDATVQFAYRNENVSRRVASEV